MATKIISDGEMQIMYYSVTMKAFGPAHFINDGDLNNFLEWLPKDPITYSSEELELLYEKWKVESFMADEGNY